MVKYDPEKNGERAIDKVDDIFILDGVDFQMSNNSKTNEANAKKYLNGLIDNTANGTTIHLYASADDRSISKVSKLSIDVLGKMAEEDPKRIVKNANETYSVKDEKGNVVLTFETQYFENANHGNLCEKAASHISSELGK